MPDPQSLARLPRPIHDDGSGRRRAENSGYPVVAMFGADTVLRRRLQAGFLT